ncbi:hypothetical protein GFB56_09910 [Ensifer sp. T173]|uniref:Uncharacterized protein n=1 Tax=Ensifer canadensis TaxID=555315 RepID=A0AAW4FJB7_9HYPH|nr:hypothetical protein [Ensifer canadensis]MBM3091131.1 hypothetical protein [Ensifer canadensis]UBI75815.1 hypothetical protein J3R84_01245 [Ensifer canadensis]
MVTPKTGAEGTLDRVRRELAKANTASEVLSAGKALPDLIAEIEGLREALDDEIAAEAESIDRTRASKLRAEKAMLGDLLNDAEYLERRIDEKHKVMLKNETEAAMSAKRASAAAKQLEAQAVLLEVSAPLQAVVDGLLQYQRLAAEIEALNNQLRAGNHHELCIRPPLHVVTKPDENLAEIFDFMRAGRFMAGQTGPNLLEVTRRLKSTAAGK